MNLSWLTISFSQIWLIILSTIAVYVILAIYIRMVGLRSFSKMSGHDFVVTIAIGALIASAILGSKKTIIPGSIAIGMLFLIQVVVNYFRNKFFGFARFIDNEPVMLMKGSEILDKNLKKVRVSRKELRYKLRAANVTQLSQVKAVVLESTGDVTVLHHPDSVHQVDKELICDVSQ